MKKTIFYISILLLGFSTYSQNNNIIGKWLSSNDNNIINAIEFKSDSTAIMFKENKPSPIFTYAIDSTKNPFWIKLSIEKEGKTVVLTGLLKLIDDDTIKLEIFQGKLIEHPIEFTQNSFENSEKLFVLKRKK